VRVTAVVALVVGLPAAVHALGDRTCLCFSFHMVIVGMCASYRHMAAGPTTQKFRVAPDQGAREGGGADLVLRPIPSQ
jgi:hypothetical protein